MGFHKLLDVLLLCSGTGINSSLKDTLPGNNSATRILILYSLQPFTRGVVQCNLAELLVSANKDNKPVTERSGLFSKDYNETHVQPTWRVYLSIKTMAIYTHFSLILLSNALQ